jgi:DNA-binding response OmpR family regulator
VTVRDSKQDTVAGLQAGANDYVTKPVSTVELLAAIGPWLPTLEKASI